MDVPVTMTCEACTRKVTRLFVGIFTVVIKLVWNSCGLYTRTRVCAHTHTHAHTHSKTQQLKALRNHCQNELRVCKLSSNGLGRKRHTAAFLPANKGTVAMTITGPLHFST